MIKDHYFCPTCKNIEVDIQRSPLADVPSTASCGHCGWAGLLKDCTTFISREVMHGVKDFSEALGQVLLTRAAAPITAVLETLGMLPQHEQVARVGWKVGDLQAYNAHVDVLRGEFIGELMAQFVKVTIEECGKIRERSVKFAPKTGDQHE